MSDQGGPKRTSTEPTLVIPRDMLAPVSSPKIHVTDETDEPLLCEEKEPETMVPCPARCTAGMVSQERERELVKLLQADDPGEAP